MENMKILFFLHADEFLHSFKLFSKALPRLPCLSWKICLSDLETSALIEGILECSGPIHSTEEPKEAE